MFPLDLVTCFANLLHNEVPRVVFNDGFDCGLLVPGHDDEPCNVRRDAVVLNRRKLDRLDALGCGALTMEWEYLLDAMLFRAFLDPLIDRTKDFLVAGGRVREIHQHIKAAAMSEFQCSSPYSGGGRCRDGLSRGELGNWAEGLGTY